MGKKECVFNFLTFIFSCYRSYNNSFSITIFSTLKINPISQRYDYKKSKECDKKWLQKQSNKKALLNKTLSLLLKLLQKMTTFLKLFGKEVKDLSLIEKEGFNIKTISYI